MRKVNTVGDEIKVLKETKSLCTSKGLNCLPKQDPELRWDELDRVVYFLSIKLNREPQVAILVPDKIQVHYKSQVYFLERHTHPASKLALVSPPSSDGSPLGSNK